MKKYPANLLSKTLFLFVFFISVLIIHSCRKDFKVGYEDVTDPDIQQAMEWFNQANPLKPISVSSNINVYQTASTNTIGGNVDLSQHIRPNWHLANKFSRFGSEVYEMPFDDNYKLNGAFKNSKSDRVYSDKYTRNSYLVIKNGQQYKAYIMQIIADSAYLNGDFKKLNNNTYFKHDKDFSGIILYFTPQGDYVSGCKFENGRNITANPNTTNSTNKTSPAPSTGKATNTLVETTCTHYYWVETQNGKVISVRYLYSICSSMPLNGNENNGGVPPPVPCPETTNTGSSINKIGIMAGDGPHDDLNDDPFPQPSGSTANCITKIIEDSLKRNFPCATKLIVDSLKNIPAYNTFIAPFTSNSRPNLSWQNGPLPWNTPSPSNSSSFTFELGNTQPIGASSVITLNTQMLQNSSQLFVAATSIHETLHAYLNYYIYWDHALRGNGVPDSLSRDSWLGSLDTWASLYGLPSNYSNHNQMLGGYFDQMVNILAAWDKNGHTLQEYRMSMLYGLDHSDGNTVQTDSLKAFYNRTKTKYSMADTTINRFYNQQLKASVAKRLPGNCN